MPTAGDRWPSFVLQRRVSRHHHTSEELKGIIAHEVYHCALKHHTRRNGRDPKEWNQATDFVINPMVLKAGLKLPTWVLLDPKYDGLSAEQVYRIRQQQRQQQQQGREGQAYHSQRGDDGEKPGNSGQNEPADVGDNLEPNNKSNNYSEEGGEEPHDDDLDTGGKLGEEPSGSERSTTGVRSCADSSIPAREKITLGRDRTVGFSRPD